MWKRDETPLLPENEVGGYCFLRSLLPPFKSHPCSFRDDTPFHFKTHSFHFKKNWLLNLSSRKFQEKIRFIDGRSCLGEDMGEEREDTQDGYQVDDWDRSPVQRGNATKDVAQE